MKRSAGAALSGLLAGALTLGVATLLAGLLSRVSVSAGQPSPVVAVGGAFVDRTPLWLKNFAVSAFGTHDKLALFVGMALVLAAVCAALGVLAARRRTAGFVAFAVVGALGAAAVLSRPGSRPLDMVPTLVGTVAGLWALSTLLALGARAQESRAGFDRRRLLVGGAGIAAAAAATAAVGQALGGRASAVAQARADVTVPQVPSPVSVPAAAQLDVPGITPYVVPNADFYRIDTALVVPQLDTGGWRLRVHGMVEREVELDWDALLSKPMQQALVTLTCVSNEVGGDLVGNAVWIGWPVRELLAMAGPRPGADMVLSTSVDGFTAGTPLEALTDDRDALLAVAHERRAAAGRARVPGADGRAGAVRLRLGDQVGGGAEGHDVRRRRGVLDARGAGPSGGRSRPPRGSTCPPAVTR